MNKGRTHNTILNAATGMLVTVLNIVLSFVVRTIFIRTLGIQYSGVSSVFNDILMVLSFTELGIGSAITYALYKPIADNDRDRIGKLMTFYRRAYWVISGVIFVIGLCLLPFLNYIITDVPDVAEDIRLIYMLYIIRTALSYLFIYKSTLLTAAQKDYEVSKIKIWISLAKSCFECILLLVFHNFIIYLIFNIVIIVVQNILVSNKANRLYPEIKKSGKESISRDEKKKLFGDVRALFLYKVSGVVLNGTDSIIISSFIGTIYSGLLGNYTLISNQLYTLITQIFTATSASVGNLAAVETKETQYTVFKRLLFLCFLIYCFCSSCLWTLFQPFITIWLGKDFLLSTLVVVTLVLEFYLRGMLSPISSFRTSNGLFVQGKYRPVIMSLINIVVSVALAPVLGVAGVLLGTIISRASTQLWYDPILIYRRVFKVPSYKYFIRYGLYFLTMVGCCGLSSLITSFITISNPFIGFILKAIIAVIIPIVVVSVFYGRTDEFHYFLGLVKKLMKKKNKKGD